MPTPGSIYASPVLAYALATSASAPALVTYATGFITATGTGA